MSSFVPPVYMDDGDDDSQSFSGNSITDASYYHGTDSDSVSREQIQKHLIYQYATYVFVLTYHALDHSDSSSDTDERKKSLLLSLLH